MNRHKNASRFHRLKLEAASGNTWAKERLKWHVERWRQRGARFDTIAKKLGLTQKEVIDYAGKDMRPRLVKNPQRPERT